MKTAADITTTQRLPIPHETMAELVGLEVEAPARPAFRGDYQDGSTMARLGLACPAGATLQLRLGYQAALLELE